MSSIPILICLFACRPAVAAGPGFQWRTTAPETQGLFSQGLEALKTRIENRTKALLVIRNDTIVYEWYAPDHGRDKRHYTASLAKALVGGMSLALARDAGLLDAVLQPPYPPSERIVAATFAPAAEIVRQAAGSDNWPMTWADDGHLYTAYGDGWGFTPRTEKKLSLGIARVEGRPPAFTGINIRTQSGEELGDGARGIKASGMLMVNGTLYMLTRNAANARLAWSADHGQTWSWADWRFTESFGCPTFLNFGKDYDGARDEYVYVYSPDADTAYEVADRMVLARVRKDAIRRKEAYEYLSAVDDAGRPAWSKDVGDRGAVFRNPGKCYRSGVTYNAGLKRYLWCQVIPASTGKGPRFAGGLGVFAAPEPWGPWRTVFYTRQWDVGPGETASLPTAWMSRDGRNCHLVFSGDDHFSVRKVTFTTSSTP